MRLSLGYFFEKLHAVAPTCILHESNRENAFSSVEILAAYDPAHQDHILYVDISPENPPTVLPSSTVVTYSSRIQLFPQCALIEIPDDLDMVDIYKALTRELTIWHEWVDKINYEIVQHADLQKIIDTTRALVSNPMYIADSSFKVIAATTGEMAEVSAIWNYQQKYGYLPFQVMQNLIETGELKLLNESPHAFRIESQSFNLPFVSKSIHRHNNHYGYFFIIELYEQLTDCDLEVAEYLGRLLSSAMFYEKDYFEISGFYYEHFFVDVIEGKLTDPLLIENQLKPLQWETDGDYLFFQIDTSKDNEAIRHHAMAILSGSIDARCLTYRDNIVGIVSNASNRFELIYGQLNNLSRTFNRRVALSDGFIHFCDLRLYYEQTLFSLSYLESVQAPIGPVSYSKLFLHHINALTSDFIPENRLIELLRTHDRDHNTDYCNTLYCWLTCDKNTVKAAGRLFIHRNTLIYRLEKIGEIAPLRADSVNEQLQLILSLHKYCGDTLPD